MNICLVNHASYAALANLKDEQIGGEEVQHALLARSLAARGHRVCVVSCDFAQADGAQIDGVTVHSMFQASAGIPVLRFLHPRWTGLDQALRRSGACIYYVSCAGALVGQVAAYVARHSKQLVFRVASDSDCDPRTLLVGNPRDRFLYRYGLRRSDRISVQTEHQRNLLKVNYGLDSEVVPMLVDLPNEIRPRIERDIDVLWVANLRALKRPEIFVELAAALPGLRFSLVGGEARGEAAVARQVLERSIAHPNLTLHGRLSHSDVLPLFQRARVFVNTSRIEGFPNTFLQAWAHGVPTVSFFDPDAHIVKFGLGARVLDFGGMCKAVLSLTANHSQWSSASDRCLQYMQTRYSNAKQVAAYERMFAQCEQQ